MTNGQLDKRNLSHDTRKLPNFWFFHEAPPPPLTDLFDTNITNFTRTEADEQVAILHTALNTLVETALQVARTSSRVPEKSTSREGTSIDAVETGAAALSFRTSHTLKSGSLFGVYSTQLQNIFSPQLACKRQLLRFQD